MGFYHCLQPVPLVYFEYFVVSSSGMGRKGFDGVA